uniref:Uncharacterized protein n=1 Tax=Salix viminalis TaxID=40686 RepID=A0A6N2KPT7_SALVM
MAELVEETSHEETRDDGAFANLAEANPKFLLELNLLIMVLSLVNSSSPEDCLDYSERETGNFRDQEDQQQQQAWQKDVRGILHQKGRQAPTTMEGTPSLIFFKLITFS